MALFFAGMGLGIVMGQLLFEFTNTRRERKNAPRELTEEEMEQLRLYGEWDNLMNYKGQRKR